MIREFLISDYEDAVTFWSDIEGISLNESDTKEAIASFLERNLGFSAITTDEYGAVIGAVLCGHNGRAGSLNHLAVAPEYRGKGLGRQLIQFCFTKLAAAKIPRCNIFVYTDNHIGNKFWLDNEWNDPSTWKVLQKHVR